MVNDYNLSSLRNIILGAAPVSTELILDTRAKLRAKGAKDLEITQVWSLLFHLSCILSIPTVTNLSGVRSYRDDVSKLFASRPVIKPLYPQSIDTYSSTRTFREESWECRASVTEPGSTLSR